MWPGNQNFQYMHHLLVITKYASLISNNPVFIILFQNTLSSSFKKAHATLGTQWCLPISRKFPKLFQEVVHLNLTGTTKKLTEI